MNDLTSLLLHYYLKMPLMGYFQLPNGHILTQVMSGFAVVLDHFGNENNLKINDFSKWFPYFLKSTQLIL